MAVITLSFRSEDLTRLRTEWPVQMEIAKANIAQKTQSQGRALVHAMLGRWQSPGGGRLAKSLTAFPTHRGMDIKIGAGLDYADDVFFGAPPHTIRPKTGRALHWSRFGIDFFFGAVEHPGQPARLDIIEALEELVIRIIEDEIEAMLRAISISGVSAA